MKNIFLILLLVVVSKSFAQDPDLISNIWSLQKIVIDDVEYTSPMDAVTAELIFDKGFFYALHNFCENGLVTEIEYSGNDVFINANAGVTLIGTCFEPPALEFYARHFSIYIEDDNFTAKNPFSYTLSSQGNLTTLVITNGEGNQGYYESTQLETESFVIPTFRIFPNPVHNILRFSNLEETDISEIIIYDLMGNVVCSKQQREGNDNLIDVSNFSSGIYLFKAIFKEGNILSRKFIKY